MEVSSAFHRGVTALEIGAFGEADQALRLGTELAPGEPAIWSNMGLLSMRRGVDSLAVGYLKKAMVLAPENSEIHLLLGHYYRRVGSPQEAIGYFRRAWDLDAENTLAGFALAAEMERFGEDTSDVLKVMDRMIRLVPDNQVLAIERARLLAGQGNADAVLQALEALDDPSSGWPDVAIGQLGNAKQAIASGRVRESRTHIAFLKNALARVPSYRRDAAVLSRPDRDSGDPIKSFLRIANSRTGPSPPDATLDYVESVIDSSVSYDTLKPTGRDSVELFGISEGRVLSISRKRSALLFPGGSGTSSSAGILPIDFDNDFDLDLVLVGEDGLRLFVCQEDTLLDWSSRTALSAEVLQGSYTGAWAVDLELDGDLDMVLGGRGGPNLAIRNHGDGSWDALAFVSESSGIKNLVWADLDGDGDGDLGVVGGQGVARRYTNAQGGQFESLPDVVNGVQDLAVTDLDGDELLDLACLTRVGVQGWGNQTKELSAMEFGLGDGERLFVQDLDNNGSSDFLVTGSRRSRIWLSGGTDRLEVELPAGFGVDGVTDLNGDGLLDLVGRNRSGHATLLTASGSAGYHWQFIRPRTRSSRGDGRMNTFALGGEVTLHAMNSAQIRPVSVLPVHFGLGERRKADVLRVEWPNGTVQAEFGVSADQTVLAEQRLKGSCPWVFGFDGNKMTFVKDFLWRSPLGMRINAQVTAGSDQTEDRILIPSKWMVPRDGFYDLRITAELWETHFVDHVSLLVVDHSAEVDVIVDERFTRSVPDLGIKSIGQPIALGRAVDELGLDVTDLLANEDGEYVDSFELGKYQGVTEDHWVEMDIGSEAADWLVATGWIYPTDSSINIALSQNGMISPAGLSLDGFVNGEWVTLESGLGFPAGKNKTILVDISSVETERLRLRSCLEIYWDRVYTAEKRTSGHLDTVQVGVATAELQYRGFSDTGSVDRRRPDIPQYDVIESNSPRWRDLQGYHTRFGDVRELLAEVDDRYVILNAGDELRLKFRMPEEPGPGWTRSFVLVGDGWVKDGDYNTEWSRTVLPLPAHRQQATGERKPGLLEEEPVYQRFSEDWQTYHTRYVVSRVR
jgi:hypothetical protein